MLWDCDNHLEKEGGKGLVRQGQGNTKTYLKQLFEDINGYSEYGRGMVNDLRDDMLNREVWRNIIREVSTAQKNKQLNHKYTMVMLLAHTRTTATAYNCSLLVATASPLSIQYFLN